MIVRIALGIRDNFEYRSFVSIINRAYNENVPVEAYLKKLCLYNARRIYFPNEAVTTTKRRYGL